ncbi:LexA family transcriptional regulator [Stutzerimonas nitrititolerans]|uniref:LexA family transcriptional regulator n=1 Tax=Stutzerimonas nitrititolerans TaxID=2482751 RepID=UPI002898C10D|nr:LexA family transcriptional regulator [Stutzerimonas nitrititolerans]
MSKKKDLSPEQRAECEAAKALFVSRKNSLGLTQAKVADAAGISPAAVAMYLNGVNPLNAKFASVLARLIGEPVERFSPRLAEEIAGMTAEKRPAGTIVEISPGPDEGGSPSSDDYALIPQYTAKGSSGNGYLNDHVEIKGGLAFKRDWLCRMGLKPDSLRVAYNHGDSNWPTLTDGEVVLLDVAAVEPANGKMFALLDPDGEMIFKRLIRDIKGGWLIRSDNDNKTLYPDMPISDEGIRGVDIVGRIVWRGGAM